jgi:hypothetical protein
MPRSNESSKRDVTIAAFEKGKLGDSYRSNFGLNSSCSISFLKKNSKKLMINDSNGKDAENGSNKILKDFSYNNTQKMENSNFDLSTFNYTIFEKENRINENYC